MIQKVLSFAQQHHMIDRGSHILAGVSGGADSVCLLLVLEELCRQLSARLTAVHIEHGIRGEESLKDAAFVKALCRERKIECRTYHCDAVGFSKERGMSLEEGARELRYGCFEELRQQLGADKIAVAHNQNDCGETLLFHLARGTGLRGMCGIAPVRDRIIRPLLCVGREEIEAFLKERQQDFCTDATNLDVNYSRNKIRHQVLPVLAEINSGAVAHMYQAAEMVRETVTLVEELAQTAKKDCMSGTLLCENLCRQPLLIQRTLVLELLEACGGSRKDLSGKHAAQVLELFSRQVGKSICLPYGLEARRTYQGVIIGQNQEPEETEPAEVRLIPGTAAKLPGAGFCVTSRILEKEEKFREIPKKTYTKWFDYDKIKNTLLLRKRRKGDYFILDSQGRRQTLKKYFINEKVPFESRDKIPVLAEDEHVLWIIGYRISEAYKVTEDTRRILEVQVDGGSTHE